MIMCPNHLNAKLFYIKKCIKFDIQQPFKAQTQSEISLMTYEVFKKTYIVIFIRDYYETVQPDNYYLNSDLKFALFNLYD